ncbi:hypothetical protein [Xanthomonas campestris]|uniref:hypothetical protein n=1 Tax=Xanthomonas campestris TaxID=339 RepID=UPI001E470CF8|nr:hypothetical protein [Xanthomonas campestris]WVL62714.1 hypothetical protein LLE68_010510 [Xanthomonas campestris pv. barbareae]
MLCRRAQEPANIVQVCRQFDHRIVPVKALCELGATLGGANDHRTAGGAFEVAGGQGLLPDALEEALVVHHEVVGHEELGTLDHRRRLQAVGRPVRHRTATHHIVQVEEFRVRLRMRQQLVVHVWLAAADAHHIDAALLRMRHRCGQQHIAGAGQKRHRRAGVRTQRLHATGIEYEHVIEPIQQAQLGLLRFQLLGPGFKQIGHARAAAFLPVPNAAECAQLSGELAHVEKQIVVALNLAPLRIGCCRLAAQAAQPGYAAVAELVEQIGHTRVDAAPAGIRGRRRTHHVGMLQAAHHIEKRIGLPIERFGPCLIVRGQQH